MLISAALVFECCYPFINIAKSNFGKIDEEAIKNCFVLIYEPINGVLCSAISIMALADQGKKLDALRIAK